jgi:hypothetical protein
MSAGRRHLIYKSPIMRHTGTLSATPTMVQKA